jgi:hypothetical protein
MTIKKIKNNIDYILNNNFNEQEPKIEVYVKEDVKIIRLFMYWL